MFGRIAVIRCKACDKVIELHAVDDTLELCNKCFGIVNDTLKDYEENDLPPLDIED